MGSGLTKNSSYEDLLQSMEEVLLEKKECSKSTYVFDMTAFFKYLKFVNPFVSKG